MAIRLAVHTDLPQILEIYRPYVEKTPYSFEYRLPTLEEFTRRFDTITAQFPWIVWEEDGTVLGYAYGSAPFERAAFSWCAELSIYLSPAIQGRGIGQRMYRILEHILTMQGYTRVYALIEGSNRPSLAFHEAMGYRQFADFPDCGYKLGGWRHIIWMEKLLNLVEMPSNFPAPCPLVVKNNISLQKILDILSIS